MNSWRNEFQNISIEYIISANTLAWVAGEDGASPLGLLLGNSNSDSWYCAVAPSFLALFFLYILCVMIKQKRCKNRLMKATEKFEPDKPSSPRRPVQPQPGTSDFPARKQAPQSHSGPVDNRAVKTCARHWSVPYFQAPPSLLWTVQPPRLKGPRKHRLALRLRPEPPSNGLCWTWGNIRRDTQRREEGRRRLCKRNRLALLFW